MFNYFAIGFILCGTAFLAGMKFARYAVNREYLNRHMRQILIIEQQEATIQEMGEVIDKQSATIQEYSDMSPAEHIRVALNMLMLERKITGARTYNQELRAARTMASRVMRQHLEPEV